MCKGHRKHAIIECYQEIPCNPCTTICPQNAISKKTLTSTPVQDQNLCNACGLCVAVCPGQAIYLQDAAYDSEYATITFPWEYQERPAKGDTVLATNRQSETLCKAEVLRITKPELHNRTVLLTLLIPQQYKDEVRSMRCTEVGDNHEQS